MGSPPSRGRSFRARRRPHARTVAETYWLDPTAESRAEYIEVCFPLYRPRPGQNTDMLKRSIVNNEVALAFNGPRNEQGRMDFRAGLKNIRCPVLVMCGDRDPIMPMPFSETIVECLPSHLVRFERFAACGHGVPLDDPERAFRVLREFITGGT